MQIECPFCEITKADKQIVREYTQWSVLLHENQVYLGWTMVVLKNHKEDLAELSDEEKDELFTILRKLKTSLNEVFNPTIMNYSSLGNRVRHLHVHVIPRYSRDVKFEGISFTDSRWGQNYAPYDKNFTIPESVRNKIKEKIVENL